MAKHLTDQDIEDVVGILDEWSPDSKLTWDELVKAAFQDCVINTTRQTLQKQIRIKRAYSEVKKITSGVKSTVGAANGSLPPSLRIAAQRLDKKNREIERLKKENNELLEQFHVWMYNAHRHGVTLEQLNEPLPSKDKV